VVEVDHHDAPAVAVALAAVLDRLDVLLEPPAVRDAGERVLACIAVELSMQ
jgi:hypothetical protein